MARTGPSTVSQVSSPGRPKDINSSLKAIGSQEVSGGILKLDLCAAKASVLNATLPHHYASILTLGKKPSTFNFLSLSPTIPLTQHVHIHPYTQHTHSCVLLFLNHFLISCISLFFLQMRIFYIMKVKPSKSGNSH